MLVVAGGHLLSWPRHSIVLGVLVSRRGPESMGVSAVVSVVIASFVSGMADVPCWGRERSSLKVLVVVPTL